jgi:hypothetical protein
MWRRFHVTNSMGTTMLITNLIVSECNKKTLFLAISRIYEICLTNVEKLRLDPTILHIVGLATHSLIVKSWHGSYQEIWFWTE